MYGFRRELKEFLGRGYEFYYCMTTKDFGKCMFYDTISRLLNDMLKSLSVPSASAIEK